MSAERIKDVFAKDVREGMLLLDYGLWSGKGLPPSREVLDVEVTPEEVVIHFGSSGWSHADPLFKFERIIGEFE